MGNWTITITGDGIHHNGRKDDADAMAAGFVGILRANGHAVTRAEFVSGTYGVDLLDLLANAPAAAIAPHPDMVHYPNGLDDPQPYTPPTKEVA